GDDVSLGRDIRVARAVVVEMILEDVRDDRDLRAPPECLELEARELQDDDVVGAETVDLLDDRRADVATDKDAPPPERQDARDELLGRLRVRDGHDRALADKKSREARGGAAFAESDDRHAPAAELLGSDLGIEGDRHPCRPMKPSCVPYRPSASRPRYDHRSCPPLSVQIRDTSIDSTP